MRFYAALLGACLASTASMASQASEPGQVYVGISYVELEQYDLNRFFNGGRFESGDVVARLGSHLNRYFSSELRLATTINPKEGRSSFTQPPSQAEFGRDYMFSGFLRAGYPLGPVRPYVAVGYTFGKERFKYAGGKDRDTFRDTSLAAGIDLALGEHLGVNLEFTQYYDIGHGRLQGPSAGLFWNF